VALDIQNRLQRAGYLVPAIALSGEEAIAYAEQMHPDLMLVTTPSPQGDGFSGYAWPTGLR
jgi:DNA-binding response OmpR family regulator